LVREPAGVLLSCKPLPLLLMLLVLAALLCCCSSSDELAAAVPFCCRFHFKYSCKRQQAHI
jgi:hypothetical protein